MDFKHFVPNSIKQLFINQTAMIDIQIYNNQKFLAIFEQGFLIRKGTRKITL